MVTNIHILCIRREVDENMNIIEEAISQISIDQAIAYENLTVYPLLGNREGDSDYMILDEAIALDCVKVTEVSESGSVPELLLKNEADKPVLLLDGEELIGAKQNRIINLTILAPANQSIKIPVSCVEAGRWTHRSEAFSTSDRVFYSKGRSQKMDQLHDSLRRSRRRNADQSAIWNSISEKSANMKTESNTGAMADIFEQHESSIKKYCQAFLPTEKQVGAMFAINGEIRGFELFDRSTTLKKLLPKLVQSYALDAIEDINLEASIGSVESIMPQSFLDMVIASEKESFPAIGLGEDVRLKDQKLSGAALINVGELIHLCVFHKVISKSAVGRNTNMRSASVRLRNNRLH